jgi:hypothetical protein
MVRVSLKITKAKRTPGRNSHTHTRRHARTHAHIHTKAQVRRRKESTGQRKSNSSTSDRVKHKDGCGWVCSGSMVVMKRQLATDWYVCSKLIIIAPREFSR